MHIYTVVGEVRFGGWEDDACVVLIISLDRTQINLGSLMPIMTTPLAQRIADWIKDQTDAQWVVACQARKGIKVKSTGGQ